MSYEYSQLEFDEKRDFERCPAWFSDEMHQTPLMKPLVITHWLEPTTQSFCYALEYLSFPYCKGWDWRIVDGMGYLTVIPVTNKEEIKQREIVFRERLKPFIEDYPKVWGEFKAEMNGYWEKLDAVDITKLNNVDLLIHFQELLRVHQRL